MNVQETAAGVGEKPEESLLPLLKKYIPGFTAAVISALMNRAPLPGGYFPFGAAFIAAVPQEYAAAAAVGGIISCLTDGGMYYSEKGDELKKFNTKEEQIKIITAEEINNIAIEIVKDIKLIVEQAFEETMYNLKIYKEYEYERFPVNDIWEDVADGSFLYFFRFEKHFFEIARF